MKAKFIITSIIILLVASVTTQAQHQTSFAQTGLTKVPSINVFGDDIPANAPGLHRMRIGKNMMFGGVALVGLGAILIANADGVIYYRTTYSPGGGSSEEGNLGGAIGLMAAVGGVGLFIPGAVIYSKGKQRYNEYLKTRTSISFKFSGNSVGVGFRF